jgi:hypothetical protein
MLQGGDKKPVFCCSYPKCGRSWLRFILANYFNCLYEFEDRIDFNNVFTLLPNGGPDPTRGMPAYRYMADDRIPLIAFVHAEYRPDFEHFDFVFLVRGVHDTLVSNYFQASRRLRIFAGDIKTYIRDDNIGVLNYIDYLNGWSDHLRNMNHKVLSYENLHSDANSHVADLLGFLGMDCDAAVLAKAIELSSFSNMQKVEIQHGFPNPNLQLEASDNNALRAREGKIGSYVKYLDDDDVQFIDDACDSQLSACAKELMTNAML